MSKKITGFNVERATSSVARSNVFDRIIKEIEPVEIPAKYIQRIVVQYKDGTSIELQGDSINHPLPVSKETAKALVEDAMRQVHDVKLYLRTDVIEQDVNVLVEHLLGPYC